jgi:hypothetical protein
MAVVFLELAARRCGRARCLISFGHGMTFRNDLIAERDRLRGSLRGLHASPPTTTRPALADQIIWVDHGTAAGRTPKRGSRSRALRLVSTARSTEKR